MGARDQALPPSPVNGGDRCKKMILSIYCQYDGGDRCKKTILSHLSPTTCDNIILLHPSSVNVEYILGTPVTSDLRGDNIFLNLSPLSGDNTCLMFLEPAN